MKATYEQSREWTDRKLIDINGEKIGTVDDLYFDDTTGEPEWLEVKSGLFGTHKSLVPVAQVRHSGENLMVSFTKDRVKESPHVDGQQGISSTLERELQEYYGLSFQSPAPMRDGQGAGMSEPSGSLDIESDLMSAGMGGAAGMSGRISGAGSLSGSGRLSNVTQRVGDMTDDMADRAKNIGERAMDKGRDAEDELRRMEEEAKNRLRDSQR